MSTDSIPDSRWSVKIPKNLKVKFKIAELCAELYETRISKCFLAVKFWLAVKREPVKNIFFYMGKASCLLAKVMVVNIIP